MLKSAAFLSFFAFALVCAPAVAQTNNPPPDQSAPPAADQGAPPAGGAGTKPTTKEIIAGCQADAKAKGLKGDERKSAVHDCVAAQRPKAADRMQCRQQGKAQGMAGDALKSFVQTCMAQGKQ